MNHIDHIAEIEREIARLEALRGTAQEPPALDALIGAKHRTRAWHASRLHVTHRNIGTASLFERSGRSKRNARRLNTDEDVPLAGLALA